MPRYYQSSDDESSSFSEIGYTTRKPPYRHRASSRLKSFIIDDKNVWGPHGYPLGRRGRTPDNATTTTADTELEYENFPSRDGDRELRSIRRQAAVPLAVKSWCVRDVAWLDGKLSKPTGEEDFAPGGEIDYTPFPHLPAIQGQLSVSLGVVDMRPGDPHWEGADPSDLRKLDTWFLAGAQHCLRSRSSASPNFFLRFPEIEAFETRIKSILDSLPRQLYVEETFSLPEKVFKSVLGLVSPLGNVEVLQKRLHSEKRQYLLRCLMICFNLRRLRFWLWREYNREYQRLVLGVLMLSRAMHEVLDDSGRLTSDSIVESVERFKKLSQPLVPVYRRNKFGRGDLIKAAQREWERNPIRPEDSAGHSQLASQAFMANGRKFEKWSDVELKSYALPDDDLWRTIDMHHVQLRSSDFDEREPLPLYHTSMNLAWKVKNTWKELMSVTKDTPMEYVSDMGDHFIFPPVKDGTLESIWNKITAQKDYYIYKVPKPLRSVSSMPELKQGVRRERKLYDDQDTYSLGFALEDLPARPPPRLHNDKPPAYPLQEDHPLCPLKDGPVNHSFIVIGWFPGKLMEPVEACMWYTKPEMFLNDLRHQVNQLRGWRRFLSLKTVQGFGLYRCYLKDRSHGFVSCSASENAILAQFHTACFKRALSKDRHESEEWARWVTSELNNWQGGNTFYFPMPIESHLSLRLMTRWSRYRLVLASSIPMMLSLAIGFYYMTVSDDIQTAWTVSSYIITAGAFLIAVLAVLTSLQDGGNDLGQAKKRSEDTGLGV